MLTKFCLTLMNPLGKKVWFLSKRTKSKMADIPLGGVNRCDWQFCLQEVHMPTKFGACKWNWMPIIKKKMSDWAPSFCNTRWPTFLKFVPSFGSFRECQAPQKWLKFWIINKNKRVLHTLGAWTLKIHDSYTLLATPLEQDLVLSYD